MNFIDLIGVCLIIVLLCSIYHNVLVSYVRLWLDVYGREIMVSGGTYGSEIRFLCPVGFRVVMHRVKGKSFSICIPKAFDTLNYLQRGLIIREAIHKAQTSVSVRTEVTSAIKESADFPTEIFRGSVIKRTATMPVPLSKSQRQHYYVVICNYIVMAPIGCIEREAIRGMFIRNAKNEDHALEIFFAEVRRLRSIKQDKSKQHA